MKIGSLSRKTEDTENNQVENLKLRKHINQNLKRYWMALVSEWKLQRKESVNLKTGQ